ncbi:MAG: helix-turn-helix domain-containing protein [Bacteroidota bacterium]
MQDIASKRSSRSIQVKRSYILLVADENGDKAWKDTEIQATYAVGLSTIERLRQRFVEEGFSTTLKGKLREVYKEKVLDGQVEAKLIALRCSHPPQGYNKWTLRLLADKMVSLEYAPTMSPESVRQILKKHDEALAGEKLGDPKS